MQTYRTLRTHWLHATLHINKSKNFANKSIQEKLGGAVQIILSIYIPLCLYVLISNGLVYN